MSDEKEDVEYAIAKLRFREPELKIKVLMKMKNLDFEDGTFSLSNLYL